MKFIIIFYIKILKINKFKNNRVIHEGFDILLIPTKNSTLLSCRPVLVRKQVSGCATTNRPLPNNRGSIGVQGG
jgi:hypothetical protein